jgi:alkanesulfonate monooxygenase SsuD/methylene tetrahydromethanopterin reductase-like flavin-dependent oxidoreductase (luciferase family)
MLPAAATLFRNVAYKTSFFLRSGLIGTPARVINRIGEFEKAGIDLFLLQCSPQLEEMEQFADQVIRPIG